MSIDLVIAGIQALPKFEKVSTVDLQRELKIIYPTACRVMDALVYMAFVSDAVSILSGKREINRQ